MLKYTGKYWAVILPLLKKSMNRYYGSDFVNETVKKAKLIYREKQREPVDRVLIKA